MVGVLVVYCYDVVALTAEPREHSVVAMVEKKKYCWFHGVVLVVGWLEYLRMSLARQINRRSTPLPFDVVLQATGFA